MTFNSYSPFNNLHYGINMNKWLLLDSDIHNFSEDDDILNLMKQYKKVAFGDKFNDNIDYLPEGITHLHLGRKFDKPLNNLPLSLKCLLIEANKLNWCDFSQSLDFLPSGLEFLSIKLSNKFNYPIDLLPSSLKYLYLGCKGFKHPINNLPCNLEELSIVNFDIKNTHDLPLKLKEFNITEKLNNIEKADLTTNLISKYPEIIFQI